MGSTTWVGVSAADTCGWESPLYTSYVNYGVGGKAWHTLPYGWSAWLRIADPWNDAVCSPGGLLVDAVQCAWDGDGDVLNEVQVEFAAP